MAFSDDLKSFLEDRLIAFDPTVDLSENSPAQLHVITPIIQKFGEDPFSIDIPTFIRDRLLQEFPELASDNGGLLEDILTKPLQLLLEPFKREIELVKIGASVNNSTIMSEEEADALGANWFTDRQVGDFASGTVRLFFSQPTSTRVTTDRRCSTSDGRSYFPVQNYFISSAQMIFNKQGNFFFLDIVVRAESAGSDFNVERGDINSIEDVPGVIKVANLNPFVDGDPRETNDEYFDRIQQSLTDRSLVTKRGVLARVEDTFDGVKALQILGAGDAGMNRDILTGTGEGFLHLVGKATLFGNWLLASEVTYRDDGSDNSITPQVGDIVKFHETTPAPSTTTVVVSTVDTILSTSGGLYLFLLKDTLLSPGIHTGAFSLLKPGTITISNIPGGISSAITVADNTVHLGGHTDVFVRPSQDADSQSTLQTVSDDSPTLAITDLTVPDAGSNKVTSSTSNFISSGITDKDVLVIDTGSGFAGSYKILQVEDANNLRLDSIFTLSTTTNLRARIVRNIHVDLVDPKISKLPYTSTPVSDLITNVGSNEFKFATVNVQDFGTKIGDTIEILDGVDAGKFIVIGFGPIAGSVLVDRVATATGSNLGYKIYTEQTGLDLPVIRIKDIEVLDSTGQSTGIVVPYGDAVDVRPEFDFDSAGHEKTTYDKQLIIFPDMTEWASGGLTSDPVGLGSVTNHTDARYTLGLEKADGVIRKVSNNVSNQIRTTEINVPPFLWNGKSDKLLALVSRTDPDFPSTIAGTHKSSDLADAKIGDSLTINDGPNQGKYLIIDHRILDLWGKADVGHRKVALIQVDPPLKVDPIRNILNLINTIEGSPVFTATDLFALLDYAADWDNSLGFYTTLVNQLSGNFSDIGITMSPDSVKAFIDPIVRTGYTTGPSAQGNFRLYFLEPVSAEFQFGVIPTTFTSAADPSKIFRIDPNLSPSQLLPESIAETSPLLWARNLGVRNPQDTFAFLTSGSTMAARGIKAGDELDVYPAINDLPARGSMTSSWMCVTQTGSNVIDLIVPPSDGTSEQGYGGVDNFTTIVAGQLLFIDSGPDIGAYTVTKVLTQNWASNPAVVKLQIDQTLSHSTESLPVLSTATVPPNQSDFSSNLPAYVQGTALTFPINLNGKHLKIDTSTDGGGSFVSVEHTFVAVDPYVDAAAVLADINSDSVFIASVVPSFSGNSLVLTHITAGPRTRVRVNSSPTAPSAHTTLGLTNGAVGSGVRGAATLPGTKRIYGTGLNQCVIGDYITLYAANSAAILSAGDDSAVIGTYKISSIGTDSASAPFWTPYGTFVELERTDNFPTGNPASVRWLRHKAPETDPANTSAGGKEISDQYVRFRLYDSARKKLTVTSIPWATASVHPLLSNSEQQIQLTSPGIVNTGAGQRNFSHKSPFRIVRPGVVKVSSTEMSTQREGALYFVDIPVVGYGPGQEMNVPTSEGFYLSGTYNLDGYTLEVEDENFTYSSKEQLHIILPNSVLPVGSTASLDNQFNIAGQNLQISYNNAPIIDDLQAFFDSPLDRITVANMLARHFIPGYVLMDATYTGGSSEAVVASDIINYIDNIDPDISEIRTDLVQDIIKKNGAATVTLPITLIVLFHGIDRRIRGMRSKTSVGIGDTPFFKGTFQQTYFIAGSNTSKEDPRPNGEQIFLLRI
jgi:hypothetical protein